MGLRSEFFSKIEKDAIFLLVYLFNLMMFLLTVGVVSMNYMFMLC